MVSSIEYIIELISSALDGGGMPPDETASRYEETPSEGGGDTAPEDNSSR